jgi:hypothetical protein
MITMKRRVMALEQNSSMDYLPVVLVSIDEGDDSELAIKKRLKEEKYEEHECFVIVQKYVKPKPTEDS